MRKQIIKLANFYDKFIIINELFSEPTFDNNEAVSAKE
jgi:DNA-binding transcriptional MocR family regulator